MHRVRLAVASMTALITLQGSLGSGPDTSAACNPKTYTCETIVTLSGHHPDVSLRSRTEHRSSSVRKVIAAKADTCQTRRANPQPPKSDPVWDGHRKGNIVVYPCWLLPQMDGRLLWAPAAPNTQGAVTVSPAQLARQALAQLRIPEPVIRRSPDASAVDTGGPVTWVNMWTWVWTQKETWRQL